MKLLLVLCTVILFGCKSTNTLIKQQEAVKQLESLETVLHSKQFTVSVVNVLPSNTYATQQVLNTLLLQTAGDSSSSIDVQSEGYFLTVKDNIAIGDLPFFGERRVANAYTNAKGGIMFNNVVHNFKMVKNARKKLFTISFDVDKNTQNYSVYMLVYANKQVNLTVNTSHTTTISYTGKLSSN